MDTQVFTQSSAEEITEDILSAAVKARPLVENPCDEQALLRMKKRTPARIGVGHAGPRLKTQTVLTLRADHARAIDAVCADVSDELLERLGLFKVQTMCDSKNTFIKRPDLGRRLSRGAENTLRRKCAAEPDVQIYAADGSTCRCCRSMAIRAQSRNHMIFSWRFSCRLGIWRDSGCAGDIRGGSENRMSAAAML